MAAKSSSQDITEAARLLTQAASSLINSTANDGQTSSHSSRTSQTVQTPQGQEQNQ